MAAGPSSPQTCGEEGTALIWFTAWRYWWALGVCVGSKRKYVKGQANRRERVSQTFAQIHGEASVQL